ncbi:hypothetical protein [Pyxidicoccus xibeiensis]|uniref:hypothetical protein n=1 Tax=Pyxidicoccus xibeiensis TaxID=2906759 RepID=UPI0020A76B00|nr:hypothetical protein [Pyxidicoccus xibeiensis]MCP3140409.1 hypothetical protein [Pyxidicoccus xibeiensis]
MRSYGGNITGRAMAHFRRSFNPVALVASAESVNPYRVADQVALRELYLKEHVPWAKYLVFMVPPEVESLLFLDEGIVNAVLPGPVSLEDRVRGRYEALKVLEELFARVGEGPLPDVLIQRLAQADLSALWKLELLKPLEAFLLEVCRGQSPPSPSAP